MATFTCPGCGTRYRVPDGAAGKRVRCKKCGNISQIPDDEGPIRIADEPDDFLAEAAAAAERARAPGSTGPPPAAGVSAAPGSDVVEQADALVAAGRQADIRPAGRTFWGDVAWSFLFITQPGSIVTFVIIWILHIASEIVAFAGCIGTVASLILAGWIYAFMLNCIVEAASGEDDLPNLALTEGFLDDVVIPFVKFFAVTICCLLPAVIYLIVAGGFAALSTLVGDPTGIGRGGPIIAALLLLAGLFFWPILILVVSMGGLGTVFRVDLLVATMFRTFLPYLGTSVLVGASFVAKVAVASATSTGSGLGALTAFLSAKNLMLLLLGLGLTAYVQISAMRIIGMYYRHYKHRFAWEWG